MKINWQLVKQRFQFFDPSGLDADTVRSLKVFIYAVMGGVVWSNITTGVAMTGYMKQLGASDFLYGIVMALPPLANAFQFLVSYWMERTLKRTELFMISGLIQRSIWIPLALAPFFVPATQPQLRLWSVVVLAAVSAGMGPLMNVPFYSLLNDVVPMRIRGRYLATRSKISTLVGLLLGLITGFVLDALPGYAGYAVVFVIAGVFGLFDICCYFFTKLPPMRPTPGRAGLWTMLRQVLSDKKYMRMVLSLTAWFFSVQLCAPYMNVFARSGVMMSNFQVILTGQVMYNLLLVLVVSKWGRAMDEYGNKPVFVVSCFLSAFMPAFWIWLGPGMMAVVAVSQAFSGATYCAVDLSAQNLFMNQAPEKNRSMYYAVYFIFTQLLGLALGSAAGGFLLDNVLCHVEQAALSLGGVPFTRYNALFALSTALRLTVVLSLLVRIEDAQARPVADLARAMRAAPARFAAVLRYGIKRRALRKQYDRSLRQGRKEK